MTFASASLFHITTYHGDILVFSVYFTIYSVLIVDSVSNVCLNMFLIFHKIFTNGSKKILKTIPK